MHIIGVFLVLQMSYPQILEAKNRLKNSLGSANLQEHYNDILQVGNVGCVAVIAINCILFITRNNINCPAQGWTSITNRWNKNKSMALLLY